MPNPTYQRFGLMAEDLVRSAYLDVDPHATAARWYHYGSSLVVRSSSLPGCGLGLFTAIPRRRNDLIATYSGTSLDTHTALRLEDKSFLMRLGPNRYVDARPHLHVRRFSFFHTG